MAASLAPDRASSTVIAAGIWGKAEQVPGTASLNAGGHASVSVVSCSSAGNCGAGGSYTDGAGHVQAFVVSQRNGHWGKALKVPGTGSLNAGGRATVSSVSCSSAGNCGAAGQYTDGAFGFQAFVVSQRNGQWGKALKIPGTGSLNASGDASAQSVSCPAVGRCSAGGFYADASSNSQAFVVSQT